MSDQRRPDVADYGTPKKRRMAPIVVPLSLAVAGGLTAVYGNVHFVKRPDTAMDWTVQLCGGLTFGIIIFFIVWGHFQEHGKSG